jgi:hypothetical protein
LLCRSGAYPEALKLLRIMWGPTNTRCALTVLMVASRSRHLKSLALDGQVSRGALASLCDIFSKCNTLVKFYGLGGNVFSLAGH